MAVKRGAVGGCWILEAWKAKREWRQEKRYKTNSRLLALAVMAIEYYNLHELEY